MTPSIFRLRSVVPIPVGHRVRITHYREVVTSVGLLGGEKRRTTDLDAPRIVDLETGIAYGHFLHHDSGGIHPRAALERLSLRPELEERESFEGVVRACQVTEVTFGSGRDVVHLETWLEVAR